MLSAVDPNLEEMREHNRRSSAATAMYSVCTPAKHNKFDEDQPIQARNTPFMVMVARAAHSRGEKLVGGPPTGFKASQIISERDNVDHSNVAAARIAIYQDDGESKAGEVTPAPQQPAIAQAAAQATPAPQRSEENAEEKTAAAGEEGEAGRSGVVAATTSSSSKDDVSPMDKSVKALAFDSPAAAATGDTATPVPVASAVARIKAQEGSMAAVAPATPTVENVTLRIARELLGAPQRGVAETVSVDGLAAVIRPHVAGLVHRLRSASADELLKSKQQQRQEDDAHVPAAALVGDAGADPCGGDSPATASTSPAAGAASASPTSNSAAIAPPSDHAVATIAHGKPKQQQQQQQQQQEQEAQELEAQELEAQELEAQELEAQEQEGAAGAVIPAATATATAATVTTAATAALPPRTGRPTRSMSTPPTALDLLRALNRPQPGALAVPRRSEPTRRPDPPWRGSMDEIHRARKRGSASNAPPAPAAASAAVAAIAAPAHTQEHERPRMAAAKAMALLSRGHWFLKKLGNARDFKPQPRFVWLHVSGAGTTTRRLLCWDKGGRTAKGTPRGRQYVDLASVKRTVWRCSGAAGLDFVDSTGGDHSKGTLSVRSVTTSSEGGDAAVLQWSDALRAIGFRVRDRGAQQNSGVGRPKAGVRRRMA